MTDHKPEPRPSDMKFSLRRMGKLALYVVMVLASLVLFQVAFETVSNYGG